MIIVDASVVAKWFVAEEGSRAALQILRQNWKLIAPSLCQLEVATAMCRHVRRGEMSDDEGKMKCKKWFELLNTDTIKLVPDHELIDGAVHLSVTLKQSLQDCLYLELMQRMNGTLITADRKFHSRISPIYVDVQLLEGLSPEASAVK